MTNKKKDKLANTLLTEDKNFLGQLREEIKNQDNYSTAYPIYCVYEHEYIWPMDCDGDGAVFTSQDGDCHCFDKCEYYDGECMEHQYIKRRKFITCCFTLKAADAYIERNKHNLCEPFVYVDSLHKNPEMIWIRSYISGDK